MPVSRRAVTLARDWQKTSPKDIVDSFYRPGQGCFDGEYLQVGWTDICDTPYPEAVAALRELGVSLYGSRAGVSTAKEGKVNE